MKLLSTTIRHTLLKTAVLSLAFSGFSFAQEATEEGMMMQTSKKHKLPRLFTMRTGEVLESYAIGFSGGGNVTDFDFSNLKGSIAIGLGDVAEIGYQLSDNYGAGLEENTITEGHFKVRLLDEKKLVPFFSIAAGSNLNSKFSNRLGEDYTLKRNTIEFMTGKNFKVGGYHVGLYPSVQIWDMKVGSFGDSSFASGNSPEMLVKNYQVGLTWYQDPSTVFIFESKYYNALNADNLSDAKITANKIWENNVGVRFYLRNWLFMDAGIRHFYDDIEEEDNLSIHANISGSIPLKSVFSRMMN